MLHIIKCSVNCYIQWLRPRVYNKPKEDLNRISGVLLSESMQFIYCLNPIFNSIVLFPIRKEKLNSYNRYSFYIKNESNGKERSRSKVCKRC